MRGQQPDLTDWLELAGPVVSRPAGLEDDRRRWLLGEERQESIAREPSFSVEMAQPKRRRMLTFLVVCVVLAISASYDLVEWISALALGQGAEEFLGTQGDPWDTQSDMALALVGAVIALLTLSRAQDRQIAGLDASRCPAP